MARLSNTKLIDYNFKGLCNLKIFDLKEINIERRPSSQTFVARYGDTALSLAEMFYGSGDMVYIILFANPDIFDPLEDLGGRQVIVPEIAEGA